MEPFYKSDKVVINDMSENTLLFKITANKDKQFDVETTDHIFLPFVERKLQNYRFFFRFISETDRIRFETLYSQIFDCEHWVTLINESNEEKQLGIMHKLRNAKHFPQFSENNAFCAFQSNITCSSIGLFLTRRELSKDWLKTY